MELLAESIRPCFGRAITENDKGAKLDANMSAWLYPELQMSDIETLGCVKETVDGWECQGEGFLRATYKVAEAGKVEMTWTVTPDGSLKLSERLVCLPDAPPLFRVGVEFALPGDFSNLDFHGAGPFETYADRKSSALIARYQQNVRDQYHAGYVRPQESGTKTSLKWLKITDDNGLGLCITPDVKFSASALPLSRQMLDMSITGGKRWDNDGDQRHSLELKKAACEGHRSLGKTYVNFDLLQMGLGCVNSWGAWPRLEHRLPAQPLEFRFVIAPVNN
jgi:beta-galactosidase